MRDLGGANISTAEHGGVALEYLLGHIPPTTPTVEHVHQPEFVTKGAHEPDLILLDHQVGQIPAVFL